MVLLPIAEPRSLGTTDAASSTSLDHSPVKLGQSKSTGLLPQIGRSNDAAARRAAGDFPLGLGPADRSLLPQQQKHRRNKHIGCQTDTTELADLRAMQKQLFSTREELATVNSELHHAERRVRHEVREEMEERMRKFERRTMEKVAFLRQRQESSVNTMRRASKAQLEGAKAQNEHSLRAEAERLRTAAEAEIMTIRQELEQKDLLLQGYKRDNRLLQERVDLLEMATKGKAPPINKGASSLDVAEATAQLEAQLQSRDATIAALRDQLARMQGSGAPQQLAPSASAPTVGRGKKK